MRLALIAHDAKKPAMVAWAAQNRAALERCTLWSTGTTGRRLTDAYPSLSITILKSGPLGGDQQIGAMIAEERLDGLIFFIDPLTPMPHDVDVKALLRLGIVYDLPTACNPRTATLLLRALLPET